MIERTPWLNLATHLILILGLVMILLPIWLTFVAASHDLQTVNTAPVEFWPGPYLLDNLRTAWVESDFGPKFVNSLIVATGVVIGKITLACITAFALVFFNFRGRMLIFWMIFITLMLPLEIRIVPTYAVAANALSPFQTLLDVTGITWAVQTLSGLQIALEWNLLNSYTGLILPLVATATGTFLYRQFFLTVPDELVEAARMDGAGPLRFLWDTLIPLSKTNIAALATIMFVYAWNQYLWPLLVVTDRAAYGVVVVQLSDLVPDNLTTGGGTPNWHIAMAATLMVMLPPIAIVIFMQRWFVRGLINTDK
ncbi:ABC transporter permease subunit [Neogemmobacter tilapiae]|uniref:sn-glycerol-3-phosphate transport system permease protein UgpE n=1 Tax=Neogemmobacter tilapiae TaxID=875041 RepID=A0A918TLZ4_9RHOB|nr:ABC transporter permease subunit [Gemmobacter tilapiae]GHC53459.1 sn-glycerol-3-phosphate transport system permease protein UgpE [Gemmobacter tilapiae]